MRSLPTLASEAHGTWSAAFEAGGDNTISCGSAGDCVTTTGSSIVTETAGVLGSAQPVPGTAALSGGSPTVDSVSCEQSGCDAAGATSWDGVGIPGGLRHHRDGGTWASAWGDAVSLPLPVVAPGGGISPCPQSLSCTSPGNCTAVGDYQLYNSGFTVTDQKVSSSARLTGLGAPRRRCPAWYRWTPARPPRCRACPARRPAPGNCAAVALYVNRSGTHAAVLSETGGTRGPTQPLSGAPGQTVSQSVSCGGAAYCGLAGGYTTDGQHYQAIIDDETPTLANVTTGSLSASRVVYGREQAERVSVKVSAVLGLVPGRFLFVFLNRRKNFAWIAEGRTRQGRAARGGGQALIRSWSAGW